MKEKFELEKLLDINRSEKNASSNQFDNNKIEPQYFGQSFADISTIEHSNADQFANNNNGYSYAKNNSDSDVDRIHEMLSEHPPTVMTSQASQTPKNTETIPIQPTTPPPQRSFSFQEQHPPTSQRPFSLQDQPTPITTSSQMSTTALNSIEEKSEPRLEMLLQYNLPTALLKAVSHNGDHQASLNAIYFNHFWQSLQKNKAHLTDEEKAGLVDLFNIVGAYHSKEAQGVIKHK